MHSFIEHCQCIRVPRVATVDSPSPRLPCLAPCASRAVDVNGADTHSTVTSVRCTIPLCAAAVSADGKWRAVTQSHRSSDQLNQAVTHTTPVSTARSAQIECSAGAKCGLPVHVLCGEESEFRDGVHARQHLYIAPAPLSAAD